MMKSITKPLVLAGATVLGTAVILGGVANAQTPSSSTSSTTDQQHIQNIISKGDQEITRRQTTLNTLTDKINAATKLTSSDKTTLSNEVSTTISGLTTLKSQLDAATTLSNAKTDAQDIYTEYRVYAVVAPKVNLVKEADDQQTTEAKLTTLAQKLQSRITADQQAGKDVTTLQSELSDMTSKTNAAQSISSNVETTVITVEPTDYNSNHAVLSGDAAQLKTAHADNQAADTDAKNIVSGLKNL